MTPITTRRWALSLALFGTLFFIYALTMSGAMKSDDERFIMDTVDSVATRGDLMLNQTVYLRGLQTTDVEPAQPLMAAPLYWVVYNIPYVGNVHGALLFAPIVTALTAVLVYWFALDLRYRERTAVIAALLFGLTTIMWPYTKTFFREPLTTLNLFAAAYLLNRWRVLIRADDRRAWGWLVGGVLFGVLAVLSKEAMLITVPVLLLIAYPGVETLRRLFGASRREVVASVAGLVAVVVVVGIGLAAHDTLLNTDTGRYEIGERVGVFVENLEYVRVGLAGFLLSPGKSIWVYSPILLLALASPVLLPRERWRESWLVLALTVAFAIVYGAIRGPVWHGGLGWGSRYMLPLTPFLMVAALPALDRALHSIHTWDKMLLGVLIALGLTVQSGGVLVNILDYSTYIAAETGQPPWQVLGVWTFTWSQAVASLRLIGETPLDLLWLSGGTHTAALAALGVGAAFWGGLLVWLGRGCQRRASLGASLGGALIGVCGLLFALSTVYDDPRYGGTRADLHALLAQIEASAGPNDTIMLTSETFVPFFVNYYKGEHPWYSMPLSPGERYSCEWEPEVASNVVEEQIAPESAGMLRGMLIRREPFHQGARGSLWLVQDVGPYGECATRPVEHYAAKYSYIAGAEDLAADIRLIQVVPMRTAAQRANVDLQPVQVQFGEGMALLDMTIQQTGGYEDRQGEATPGDMLALGLKWYTLAEMDTNYTVGVYLLSPQGTVAQQIDRGPVAGFSQTSTWQPGNAVWDHYGFVLRDDLPPGEYTLGVAVYQWPSLERLPISSAAGEPLGDFLPLLRFTIR